MPRFLSSVVAASAIAVAGPISTAQAAVTGDSTPIDETFVAATCTGPDGTVFDLVQHEVGVESWSVRSPGLWPGLPDVTVTRDVTSTITNEQTGLSWSATFRTRTDDVRVLEVSDDEVTVLRAFTGHFVAFSPAGTAIDRQDTRIEYAFVVDTQGTADPADDTESFAGVTKGVGRNTVGDICEVALTWTLSD